MQVYTYIKKLFFFFNMENTNFIYNTMRVLNGYNVQLDITVKG